MRKELELIEKIDAYLQGRMSRAEKVQFEQQLTGDPRLRTAVELQQQLMTGIQRASLRDQVLKAKRRYTFRTRSLKWGLGGLVIAGVIAGLLYYKAPAHHQDAHPPIYPDAVLPTQSHHINTSRDTVIETKKGIVFALPANAFLDENNHPATGEINLVIKEALDPASIMMAGLSTRSGGQMLSTGGMFFLDATQQGHILHIDTTRPVIAQVPVKGDPAGMELYKGRRMSDGTIDWVDPRPLEHSLTPVDIRNLNFYPPDYLDSLRQWGYDIRNKHFTDSLYYSFAAIYHGANNYYKSNTAYGPTCGLDPAKIKTIWSPAFQNTNLSTREFEQRLHWLHVAGRNDLLDLYIRHLDWKLSDIDALVAKQAPQPLKATFERLAAHHDGKVNISSPQLRQLAAYYDNKARAYGEAITKTEHEYWSHQAKLDSIAEDKRGQHQQDSLKRIRHNYEDTTIRPVAPAPIYYTATVTTTGWCNIDRAVAASTLARTTLEYTDSTKNTKAVIRYLSVSIRIDGWKDYDGIRIYLLPNKLSSFMLVSGSGGNYTEKLNELLTYDLICIGYKDDQPWYYHQSGIQPTTYSNIRLRSISAEDLTRELNKAGSMTQTADLQKDNAFFRFDIPDQKRQRHNQELEDLRYKLQMMLFPCLVGEVGAGHLNTQ